MSNKAGFSLVELLIVFVCIGIIIGLTSNQYLMIRQTNTRASLELFYNTCFYLQYVAIATHQKKSLKINEVDNSYEGFQTCQRLPDNVSFKIMPGIKGPPSNPQKIIGAPITFADSTIHFYPDGAIDAGAVYLSDDMNQYALTIGISQNPFIRKYRYDQKWVPL